MQAMKALDEGGWTASCPYHFMPAERAPTTCCMGWVGPRAILDCQGHYKAKLLHGWNLL